MHSLVFLGSALLAYTPFWLLSRLKLVLPVCNRLIRYSATLRKRPPAGNYPDITSFYNDWRQRGLDFKQAQSTGQSQNWSSLKSWALNFWEPYRQTRTRYNAL